jgi:NADPH-dependent 2,4-dienoyl-CoA reductase/sulfur reductase-like enzyme
LGNLRHPEETLILQTPESIRAWYNVDVRVGNKIVTIDHRKQTVEHKTEDGDSQWTAYHKLVLAQVTEPLKPLILELDAPNNVFNLQTISDVERMKCYLATDNSNSVATIGGGFIGMEAAESLRASGSGVSVIERAPLLFPPIDQDNAEPLHADVRKDRVDLYLSTNI